MTTTEPFDLAEETPFDLAIRDAGRRMGETIFAEQMILNSRRRRSPDPRARAFQREYDRQALALEHSLITGDAT